MNIQWYPGHMAKARRKIESDVKLVDMVIELLDSRCPVATSNPDIKRITAGKQRLILLNKADLAEESATKEWVAYYKQSGIRAIAMDSRKRDSIDRIRKVAEELNEAKRKRDLERGIRGERPVRAMICGIPNVGKSTFINSMLGKASVKTGNKPGVTKGNQWINLDNGMLLLDTPGVLWPRFDDKTTARNLAMIGSVNDDILNTEELAIGLIEYLLSNYRKELFNRYSVTEEELSDEINAVEEGILGVRREPLAMLNLISMKRGCIRKKGEPDYERCSKALVDDFRSGRIGRITLERPND